MVIECARDRGLIPERLFRVRLGAGGQKHSDDVAIPGAHIEDRHGQSAGEAVLTRP